MYKAAMGRSGVTALRSFSTKNTPGGRVVRVILPKELTPALRHLINKNKGLHPDKDYEAYAQRSAEVVRRIVPHQDIKVIGDIVNNKGPAVLAVVENFPVQRMPSEGSPDARLWEGAPLAQVAVAGIVHAAGEALQNGDRNTKYHAVGVYKNDPALAESNSSKGKKDLAPHKDGHFYGLLETPKGLVLVGGRGDRTVTRFYPDDLKSFLPSIKEKMRKREFYARPGAASGDKDGCRTSMLHDFDGEERFFSYFGDNSRMAAQTSDAREAMAYVRGRYDAQTPIEVRIQRGQAYFATNDGASHERGNLETDERLLMRCEISRIKPYMSIKDFVEQRKDHQWKQNILRPKPLSR